MKITKSVEDTEYLWYTSTYAKKPKAPVQTHRNHTSYFDSEGQKYLKKHITVIMKKLKSLGVALTSSK